jgi:hypothetical protein
VDRESGLVVIAINQGDDGRTLAATGGVDHLQGHAVADDLPRRPVANGVPTAKLGAMVVHQRVLVERRHQGIEIEAVRRRDIGGDRRRKV